MAGLDLKTIHEKIAAQIRANVARDINVGPAWGTKAAPAIYVDYGDPYVSYFFSMGPSGRTEVNVEIQAYLDAANPETLHERITELVSCGTGHNSSIIDALMADGPVDDVVEEAFIGEAFAAATPGEGEPHIRIPVRLIVKKIGGPT